MKNGLVPAHSSSSEPHVSLLLQQAQHLLGHITGIGCPKENFFSFLQELAGGCHSQAGWPPLDSVTYFPWQLCDRLHMSLHIWVRNPRAMPCLSHTYYWKGFSRFGSPKASAEARSMFRDSKAWVHSFVHSEGLYSGPFRASYTGLAMSPKFGIQMQQSLAIPRNLLSCFLVLGGVLCGLLLHRLHHTDFSAQGRLSPSPQGGISYTALRQEGHPH